MQYAFPMDVNTLNIKEDKRKLDRISSIMKTIGHPSRLLIVDLLLERGKLPVRDISEDIGISQSNTSQHLKALENIEILYSDRQGTSVFYGIQNKSVAKLMRCVNECASC
jgi:ArsR family transcriptional regulator